MSDYEVVKKSKLVLKGEVVSHKRKRKVKKVNTEKERNEENEDLETHGGWCKAKYVKDITGSICIQFGKAYVKSLDNGYFTLGAPHKSGEGPDPEEILTGILISDTKVAFKSGYGKYIGYTKNGVVAGKSDAIGPLEHWEPIFEDNKLALLASNGCFLSVRQNDDTLVVNSRKAGDDEMVNVRYMSSANVVDPYHDVPLEERGNINQIEENYVRKFQKFQDKKLRINTGTVIDLEKAKSEGSLHESLLDRRSKMKSDRYCK